MLEGDQNTQSSQPTQPTQAVQPIQSAQLAQPAQPAPKPVAGIPTHRLTSISINASLDIKPLTTLENREVEQLTQERLEELWEKLVESSKDDEKFHDLIADKKVVLKSNNLFHIQVPNLLLDNHLREYQTRILGFLREATNNDSLQYKAVVVVENVAVKAYLPRDKFDEMVQRNSAMLALRKLFPDIDF